MNALIVNCSGFGDGIIEIPFLKNLEQAAPHIRYFHTEGLLFRDMALLKVLHMPGYVGNVPAEWRKFYQKDWPSILSFISSENIRLIINLRHIGPQYDSGYFRFKEQFGDGPAFLNYDFDFERRSPPVNIRDKINNLFRSNGLADNALDRQCLRNFVPVNEFPVAGCVGINMHTGSIFKRWRIEKWRSLCGELIRKGCTLSVLSGHTPEEQALSAELVNEMEHERWGRTNLVPSTDVIGVLRHLAVTECLISTDSWPVHAATGIGVRTIGLYIVSSPVMWGGEARYALPVESRHLRRCGNFDDLLGVCRNQYVTCPLIEEEGEGIEVDDVLRLLGRCVSVW